MKRNPARHAALAAAALVLSAAIVPCFGAPAVAAGPNRVAAAPGRLSGVVRDETGAALGGAEVRLSTPSGPVAGAGATDASGRYTISVAAGLYDMTVAVIDAGGPWTAQVKNLSVWSDTPLDFAVVRPDPPAPPAAPPAVPPGAAGVATDDRAAAVGPDVTWQGRILGPDGDGVAPDGFSLEPSAGAAGGTLDVAGNGAFTFTGPAGRYDLSLSTGFSPWGGGAESGPDDGLHLTGAVELTTDRTDELVLPEAATADVFVAALDGRKRSDHLRFTAQRVAPLELAPGVTVSAAVSDTLAADDGARYRPRLLGRSAVTFTVAGDPAPLGVDSTLEPGDRLAIVSGDRIAPPAAPQDVTAIPGDGKVKLAWAPPVHDGGSPVTGYVVTASHGGSTTKANVPASATAWSIKLFSGYEYSVMVAARNAKGLGPASAPLTVLLEGSPGTSPTTGPGSDPLGGAGAGHGERHRDGAALVGPVRLLAPRRRGRRLPLRGRRSPRGRLGGAGRRLDDAGGHGRPDVGGHWRPSRRPRVDPLGPGLLGARQPGPRPSLR